MILKHVAPSTDDVYCRLPERPNINLEESAKNLIRLNRFYFYVQRLVAIDHLPKSFDSWRSWFRCAWVFVGDEFNLIGI